MDCRFQHHNKTDGGSANCATHSYYPAAFSTRDDPSGCDPERPRISFTTVEAPTEEGFWLFGPTGESVTSFAHSVSGDISVNTSELFGAFGGVIGGETGSAAFMVKEGPVRGLGLRYHINSGLASMICALAMVTMIDYLWLSFVSSLYVRMVSETPFDNFGGITGAEDGSALTAGPVPGPWNDGSNTSVNILGNSGASGHYFDDASILGLRDKLDSYPVLDVPRKITTAGGGQLDGVAQGLVSGIVVNDKGVRISTQLSCLDAPGLEPVGQRR